MKTENEATCLDFSSLPGEVRDQDHLEELLLAGLNSGPGIEVTQQYWENKRTTLLERRAQRTQQACNSI